MDSEWDEPMRCGGYLRFGMKTGWFLGTVVYYWVVFFWASLRARDVLACAEYRAKGTQVVLQTWSVDVGVVFARKPVNLAYIYIYCIYIYIFMIMAYVDASRPCQVYPCIALPLHGILSGLLHHFCIYWEACAWMMRVSSIQCVWRRLWL